eukprot:Lithocolla_globosa_v1_NODE_4737_length_1377_cov_9.568079.p2 type:complete len:154 gc:universal NODE_4737_length_1377_cov_9.568079:748-287(-)
MDNANDTKGDKDGFFGRFERKRQENFEKSKTDPSLRSAVFGPELPSCPKCKRQGCADHVVALVSGDHAKNVLAFATKHNIKKLISVTKGRKQLSYTLMLKSLSYWYRRLSRRSAFRNFVVKNKDLVKKTTGAKIGTTMPRVSMNRFFFVHFSF